MDTEFTRRARYHSSADGFNIARPAVTPRTFVAERDAAFDGSAATGLVALDAGAELGLPSPATTPLILARYARIRAGEKLSTRFAASGEIYYVITGEGETRGDDGAIAWTAGDVFCLPGGGAASHAALGIDSVLWVVTDEPQLAFMHVRPPAPAQAAIEPVHYPGAEILRELEAIYALPPEKSATGKAVTFSSRARASEHTVLPAFTLAMNSLPPGESQRPHHHNAVAVTLIVRGDGCHSMVGGQRIDWQRYATMITPPAAPHSHHNTGAERALFLIVQDGGLHYHTRTMGFGFDTV